MNLLHVDRGGLLDQDVGISMPVMSPTVRPTALGLAAKLKVISQSSMPRWEPEAPRKSTSPGEKPLNGRALTLPVRAKRAAL
jgi:hypothetical protein